MLIKKYITIFLFILTYSAVTDLCSQTTEWRVIWDKNPQSDNVDHYVLFRQTGSTPNINSDIIAQIQEPTSLSQDTVMYVDGNILKGINYFYAVQAVNSDQVSSPLSIPVNVAIPKILIDETMVLKADTTYQMNLNHESMIDDPDHDPEDLVWILNGTNQISGSINPTNHILTINTPADTTITELFQFSVTDPDGFMDRKSVTVVLTALTPPPPPPPPPPNGNSEVESVVAFPVPYIGSDPPPCDCIKFQFPATLNAKSLLIYTVMGDLVFSVSDLSDSFNWDVVNSNGNKLSPGLYLYYIQDDTGSQVASGKVVIIR